MASWRQGIVRIGGCTVALTMICALTLVEPVTAADSAAESSPDSNSAQTSDHLGVSRSEPTAVGDWREPKSTVAESPTQVVEDALKESDKSPTAKLKIVSVIKKGGKPVIKTATAAGADAAKEVVSAVQDDPRLLAVEVDLATTHVLGDPAPGDAGATQPPVQAAATNDPKWSSMWGLQRLGAESVWQTTRGASDVKVAVVDTGVSRHVDLPESQILAGVDTSGEGGTDGRTDGHGHGTHVTGTIVASVDNAIGVAGLAPGVTILPVKVLKANGSGTSSAVAQGIIYAANQGADVISMSLGGDYSSVIATAVQYAISKGSLPIAAAGNSRTSGSPVSYPAALPGVVGVAATASDDTYAYFSNAGSYVDIAAPGEGIWSTLPAGKYAAWSGTSMATPHVSAVAALIISAAEAQNLNDVPIDLLMESTADDLGATGWDQDYGAGLVDPVGALAALSSPTEASPNAPTEVKVGGITAKSAVVSWTAPMGSTVRSYSVAGSPDSIGCVPTGSATTCVLTSLTPQTEYAIRVQAQNLAGGSPQSSVVTFVTEARQDIASDSLSTPTPIIPGTPVHDTIDSADDLDHWSFTSPTAGLVAVDLTDLPADYDLTIFDSSGEVLGNGWNWGTTAEAVQLQLPAGRYVALVRPYNNVGSDQPYQLLVTVPSAEVPDLPEPPVTPSPPSTPASPTPIPTPPVSDPAPSIPPRLITRTITQRGQATLPKRTAKMTLRWVNKSSRVCSLNGRTVRAKRSGICRMVGYVSAQGSDSLRLKAKIKVRR